MNCPQCYTVCDPTWKACPKCGITIPEELYPKREYKVIEITLKSFLTFASAADIQKSLNTEASNGWIYDSLIPPHEKNADKGFLVFYRDVTRQQIIKGCD